MDMYVYDGTCKGTFLKNAFSLLLQYQVTGSAGPAGARGC